MTSASRFPFLLPRHAALAIPRARSTALIAQALIRPFSASTVFAARRKPQPPPEIAEKERPFRRYDASIPEYPHGPAHFFKQQNRGLYGGLTRKMVVQVSKGRNKGKTKRVWKPNVQYKRLWSRILQRWIKVRVATKVLHEIDNEGGLDNYLLSDSPKRIKELGQRGWLLRMRLFRTDIVQEIFRAQRVSLGVPAGGLPGIGNTVRVSSSSPSILEESDSDKQTQQVAEILRSRLERVSIREPPAAPTKPAKASPQTEPKILSQKLKLYQQFGLSRKAILSKIKSGKI